MSDQNQNSEFKNGDAVTATDGTWHCEGVVTEVYDDVVYVSYFDTETMTQESMEFHESCVERYPRLRLPSEVVESSSNPLGGLPDEQQAGYIG